MAARKPNILFIQADQLAYECEVLCAERLVESDFNAFQLDFFGACVLSHERRNGVANAKNQHQQHENAQIHRNAIQRPTDDVLPGYCGCDACYEVIWHQF